MTFDISDVPLPLPQWHNQCRQLLELRKLRFFFSPLCLQPKMAFSYRVPVTQQLLHEKLSALSLSMQDARQLEALAILPGSCRTWSATVCRMRSARLS